MAELTINGIDGMRTVPLTSVTEVANYAQDTTHGPVCYIVDTPHASIQLYYGDPTQEQATVRLFTNDNTRKQTFDDYTQAYKWFYTIVEEYYS